MIEEVYEQLHWKLLNSQRRNQFFSVLFEFCTLDPVSINLEFISGTGGTEGKIFFSFETADESRVTSVSEKKLLVTRFIGATKLTVSSEVFESKVSILKHFKLISVL